MLYPDELLTVEQPKQKSDWTLSPPALQRLLQWLDNGADSQGEKYLEMSRRLVAYFDRKGCLAPDELADETLNRVARRLEEEGRIESETPAKYCYIVARFVFLEHLRANRKSVVVPGEIDEQREPGQIPGTEEHDLKEKMLDCLEHCVSQLDSSKRELIIRYYANHERSRIDQRRVLAASLGITVNALSIRACRIRDQLEECVRRCANQPK